MSSSGNTLTAWMLTLCFGAVCLVNMTMCSRNLGNMMSVIHEWKYMDYKYESEDQRRAAIRSGEFDYTKGAPIDVDQWHDKTFVTVIRDRGVPSSLNVISKEYGEGGPLLAPYPDWSWANINNCNSIVSVYRVAIDKCDRLWVLDTGIVGSDRVCNAKLLVFDLRTSKLLQKVIIPDHIATNSTTGQGLLVTPIVQTYGGNCQRTNVYIADVAGYALIFYDGSDFRRITSKELVYDPAATTYTIAGQSFMLQDGPVGMALSPLTEKLYFSPMSSYNLAYVNTRSITRSGSMNVQFREAKHILWTQASAKAMSKSGILFFGLVNDTSIGCWSEYTRLRTANINVVAANPVTLQFTSGLKIKEVGEQETLMAMTNRYQKVATGTTNFDEINFRILKGSVKELIKNTGCLTYNYWRCKEC